MRITFTKSFERTLNNSPEKERAQKAIESLISALETNIKPSGLGLKKIKENTWEVRAGLRTRVLFSLLPGEIRFLLVGDHNSVHQFLKR